MFQKNNAWSHVAGIVLNFLCRNSSPVALMYYSYIFHQQKESVWRTVAKWLALYYTLQTSVDELRHPFAAAWTAVPVQSTAKLFEHLR